MDAMDADTIYLHLTRRFSGLSQLLEKHGETDAITDLDGILWALCSGQDKQFKVVPVKES